MFNQQENEKTPAINYDKSKIYALLLCLCLAINIALLFSFIYFNHQAKQKEAEKQPSNNDFVNSIAETGVHDTASADLYDQSNQYVVGLRVEKTPSNGSKDSGEEIVDGSGFWISDRGHILTNYHVVESAYKNFSPITVITSDQNQYTASIVGVDESHDIAVLQCDNISDVKSVHWDSSDNVHVGDHVFTIGHPVGKLLYTLSCGYISGLNRYIDLEGGKNLNMIQVDMSINAGNSGGPLFNEHGNVIGMVTAKYTQQGMEGLGFVLPSNYIQRVSTELVQYGYTT